MIYCRKDLDLGFAHSNSHCFISVMLEMKIHVQQICRKTFMGKTICWGKIIFLARNVLTYNDKVCAFILSCILAGKWCKIIRLDVFWQVWRLKKKEKVEWVQLLHSYSSSLSFVCLYFIFASCFKFSVTHLVF